jgi:transposase-like protein
LSSLKPVDVVSVVGYHSALVSTSKADGHRRRRISKDEAREIGRLYAETNTPISEIRERFGIGDSSLYRIVQQQGVAPRGRTAARSEAKSREARTAAAEPHGPSTADQSKQLIAQPRPSKPTAARATRRVNGRSVGRPVRRVPVTEKATSVPREVLRNGNERHEFRILFQGERIVRATDVHDALRQTESLGAVEITAVSRLD